MDCGVGFTYNAANSALLCTGTACNMAIADDKAACCVDEQATCTGDADAGVGTCACKTGR